MVLSHRPGETGLSPAAWPLRQVSRGPPFLPEAHGLWAAVSVRVPASRRRPIGRPIGTIPYGSMIAAPTLAPARLEKAAGGSVGRAAGEASRTDPAKRRAVPGEKPGRTGDPAAP